MRSRKDRRGGASITPVLMGSLLVLVSVLFVAGYILPQRETTTPGGKDWEAETEKILKKTDAILRNLRNDLRNNHHGEHNKELDNDNDESAAEGSSNESDQEEDHHPTTTGALAYVAVISMEQYVDGAIVMGLSLKNMSAAVKEGTCKLVCIVVETITSESKARIHKAGWIIHEVPPLNVHVPKAHWADSFDKLYVFGLTQFSRIVLVDSDMLAVSNPDQIFQTKLKNSSYIGAIGNNPKHHKGPYFQSGMLVVIPSRKVNNDLFHMLLSESAPKKPKGIYNRLNARDGALLRTYFGDRYTTISNMYSKHLAPWEPITPKIKMLHFRGSFKPWSSPDAMFESKPEELAFGPGFRRWWEYYEDFHKMEIGSLEEGEPWGLANEDPHQSVWMIRYTKKAYMRKLTSFMRKELNLTKKGMVLVKGNLGESCDTACKHHGHQHKWCDEAALSFTPLSDCSLLQKVFSCSHCSYADYRKDYPAAEAPAFVVEKDLCLRNYLLDPRIKPACSDKHEESNRLCPCFMKGDVDNEPTPWEGEEFTVANQEDGD